MPRTHIPYNAHILCYSTLSLSPISLSLSPSPPPHTLPCNFNAHERAFARCSKSMPRDLHLEVADAIEGPWRSVKSFSLLAECSQDQVGVRVRACVRLWIGIYVYMHAYLCSRKCSWVWISIWTCVYCYIYIYIYIYEGKYQRAHKFVQVKHNY